MGCSSIVNKNISKLPTKFTNILVIGGSFGGLSFINNFISMIEGSNAFPLQNNNRKFSITMIEPKTGFINVIGMPRVLLDINFAKSQYIPFNKLNNLKFDNIVGKESDGEEVAKNSKLGFELNFIQGRVTNLSSNSVEYVLEKISEVSSLNFDYAILASGRDRSPPIAPESLDEHSFINEVSEFKKKVEASDKISVIGAGAVGIEISAEIKHYYPEKTVNLIHPYSQFPPEPLTPEFKKEVYLSLKDSGVNIYLETRIEKELTNGNLETVDGKIIESQYNYWSSGKKNNISMLPKEIQDKFISKDGNLLTNDYLQLSNSSETIKNIFCVGDIVELPVIKTAGWANAMSKICAANIFNLLNNKLANATLPEDLLKTKHMVLVSGNRDIISEANGHTETNNSHYVEEYKDYCFSKVKRKLNL